MQSASQMSKKMRILLADDSESNLLYMQQILEIPGTQSDLILARDGQEACKLALQHDPDLFIFDVIMPEMNGIDALVYLKKHFRFKDTPAIMLAESESIQSAYEAGATDIIHKPLNQYEILIKFRAAIQLIEFKNQLEPNNKPFSENYELTDTAVNQKILHYTKHIQHSIMPSAETIESIVPEHFILNIPKQITGGDFYWFGYNGHRRAIAVADCTGHGLSGALVSMAGMAFLNDVMGRMPNLRPADALLMLRKMFVSLLKPAVDKNESSDGMDISLTILSNDSKKLLFAGANNPVYIIQNNELLQFKGDRMPIGVHLNFERSFTEFEIQVNKGDIVYQFSDGFADQFGGPNNKKFRYKQFQDLLIQIHRKPMMEQKEILLNSFHNWKYGYKQVDDVLVLGYRI